MDTAVVNAQKVINDTDFCFAWQYTIKTDTVALGEKSSESIKISDQAMDGILADRNINKDLKNYAMSNYPRFSSSYHAEIAGEVVFIQFYGKKIDSDTVAGIAIDVTASKLDEYKIHQLAYYDALTGLPNRQMTKEFLDKEIGKSLRGITKGAVIFIDLNKFKIVNDEMGHASGDMLLKQIAARLKSILRSYDLVGRISGDEFVIVVPDIHKSQECAAIADKILLAFSKPWALRGESVYVGASLGVSTYPDDGKTAEELIRNADIAMYKAKATGTSTYSFYNADTNTAIVHRLKVESNLKKAIKNNELVVHYQPQIDIRNGRLHGLEALIRWNRPGYGLVPPLEFIGLAEESSMILDIGKYVLRQGLSDAKMLAEEANYDGRIAINFSAKQFADTNIIELIHGTLHETNMSPDKLDIEITESTILDINENFLDTVSKLLGTGVTISLDDFGTGYSSLSYLNKLPVSTIKIDKSFVHSMGTDQDIVGDIVSIGHKFGFSVVAEGVETEKQLIQLMAHGCDRYQGYYFAKPLPVHEILSYIKKINSSYTSSTTKWIHRV